LIQNKRKIKLVELFPPIDEAVKNELIKRKNDGFFITKKLLVNELLQNVLIERAAGAQITAFKAKYGKPEGEAL
jgi:hypothetical protein